MLDGATETMTVAPQSISEKQSTETLASAGSSGVETNTPIPQFEAPPDANAQAEAAKMAMMQKMRADIEAAKAQAQAQTGGENMAGATHYEEPTGMSPADARPIVEQSQAAKVSLVDTSTPPPQNKPKKIWDWSDIDIGKFFKDFAAKMKLDKAVEVVKKGFAWAGRLFSKTPTPTPA